MIAEAKAQIGAAQEAAAAARADAGTAVAAAHAERDSALAAAAAAGDQVAAAQAAATEAQAKIDMMMAAQPASLMVAADRLDLSRLDLDSARVSLAGPDSVYVSSIRYGNETYSALLKYKGGHHRDRGAGVRSRGDADSLHGRTGANRAGVRAARCARHRVRRGGWQGILRAVAPRRRQSPGGGRDSTGRSCRRPRRSGLPMRKPPPPLRWPKHKPRQPPRWQQHKPPRPTPRQPPPRRCARRRLLPPQRQRYRRRWRICADVAWRCPPDWTSI